MTTDIERQFFKTFGIKPEYQDRCTVEDKYWDNEELANEYGTFDQYMNCKCGNQENCSTECSCAYQKEVYPQITDRILLELICILSEWRQYCVSYYIIDAININTLKSDILRDCLYMLYWYEFNKCGKDIKQQIQELFKEK